MSSEKNSPSQISSSETYERIIELVREQELARQDLIEIEIKIQDAEQAIRETKITLC